MSWAALLEQWRLIEADLGDAGIDVWDDTLMRSMPWSRLRRRIVGLLDRPPVCYVQVTDSRDEKRVVNRPVFGTRVQQHFFAQEG